MTELEKLANEAVRRGTTYGKLVAQIECQKHLEKKEKKQKQTNKKRYEPVNIPINQPVEHKGKLKNGILTEHLEAWREVRRLFGR